MALKINIKFIAAGQFILGMILIAFSFVVDPHFQVLTNSFPELPSVLDSLRSASPESSQLLRAAQILEMQSSALSALRDAGEDVFATLKLCGFFMLFSGFILIVHDRRTKHDDKTST
jgi:hypothetical protein